MDVLGDAIARERRSEAIALSVPALGRRYDYRRFCTSAWKTGHFLRHLGVRSGVTVAIADDPAPESVLSFFGAATLGAAVRFDPPERIDDRIRALVVPASEAETYETGPATKVVVYGDPPSDPSHSHFERDVWSENPTEPPDRVAPDDPLIQSPEESYTHREALRAAEVVIDRHGIDSGSIVAVRGSFANSTVAIEGLIAPVVVGARLAVGPEADGAYVVGPRTDNGGK